MIIKQSLPKSWVLTDIETIRLDLHEGITPNKFPDEKFELYSVPQFNVGKPEIAYGKEIGSNKQVVTSTTVLLCKINPRINRVWITGDNYPLIKICSTEWIPFFQLSGINSTYLSYFLQNPIFREFLSINVSGVGGSLTRTKPSAFKDYPFPLPPLPEQHQIVAKIEELFSELDNGIENLKKARDQLKTYSQAVLKYAFEGKLNEEWRTHRKEAGNPPGPAEKLQEQIKAERKKHYQKQLEDWGKACEQAKTDSKKKPTKPKKPKELPQLTEKELEELPALPEEWDFIKIGNITLGVEYGSSAKSKKEGKVPVLRMGNIQNLGFDWSNLVYSNDDDEITKYMLRENDVLFNRTNSPELVGKSAIYQEVRPAIFAGYLIRINQIRGLVDAKYLNFFLNSYIAKNHGNSVKTDGVNQSNINGEKLFNYPLPYTVIDEQKKIVSEIESRLSICDHLEQTIEANLKKAETLRQSILKKAISGELTKDWCEKHPELVTGENSAEKLLEKIKSEKALIAGQKKPQSKKTTKMR